MARVKEPIGLDTTFAPAMREWLDKRYDAHGMPSHLREFADNWFRFHPWDLFAVRDNLGLTSMFVGAEEQ